ncbi:hypothetical protein CYMTET_12220 [Cymbomonas tetramitiformis]|uniref:ABC-2 type transporter transmembrane domain-containing protein n=1 Tax=Cymbomonas tetramitiformis TaxID=36881 RepID=A0AAE0LC21_9CHLO|nr:hypothetical protein CYMTET_12220 [Cymbomonas tetramitiformis]
MDCLVAAGEVEEHGAKFLAEIAAASLDALSASRPEYMETCALPKTYKLLNRPWWYQEYAAVARRTFIERLRQPLATRITFWTTLYISLIGGVLYFQLPRNDVQNRNAACFFMLMNQCFTGIFGVLPPVISQLPLLEREYRAKNMYR